jgi:hypothetical protein
MGRKVKVKPKSPEQIAIEKLIARSRDFEAVGLQPDAAALSVNDCIEVEREGQKNEERARRMDAFSALREGMAQGSYDAARRLEHDYFMREGLSDRGPSSQRVDCTAGFTTDDMLAAADRIRDVMACLSARDGWLLVELIRGHPDRPLWRQGVFYITGEATPHGQAAAVRAACVNLRDAYRSLERKAA